MPKKQLSATDAFDIRQALHVAVLDALMASRRWEPGDLVFQGGTSLHLAHGSPRFSEDLDFLVNSSLKLQTLSRTMATRLQSISWLPQDARLSVTVAKEGHNPHAFVVSVGGDKLIGSVRVKVELWAADPNVLSQLKVVVSPVRLTSGPGAGMQTFVPTASLHEIYADKVFAIAARPYLKPRDVFDLHWLTLHTAGGHQLVCSETELAVRLTTYPNETAEKWLVKAERRLAELDASHDRIITDLRRWLPSSWLLDKTASTEVVHSSKQALMQGIAAMKSLAHVSDVSVDIHARDDIKEEAEEPADQSDCDAP